MRRASNRHRIGSGVLSGSLAEARGLALALAFSAVALWPNEALAALVDHPRVREEPPASWVEVNSIAPEEIRSGEDSGALDFLLADDQVRADGLRGSTYHHRVVQVLTREGLEGASQWEIDFDPSHQEMVVHHVRLLRAGTWHDRLAGARSSVLQREEELESRIYDETLTLLLILEDVRVGDVVSLAYGFEGSNPVYGGRNLKSFRLGWSAPVRRRLLRTLNREGDPVFYRVHGKVEGVSTEPVESRENGWVDRRWDLAELPEVEFEPSLPSSYVTYPFLQLTQFESWSDVVLWARELYEIPSGVNPELAEVVAEIRQKGGDDEKRFTAAVRWVQDELRYFAVALGRSSHAPYEISDILRRRYGDCKDKTRLLIALLGELDIEAWPALVNTEIGAGIENWAPSPGAFDHVVVVARLADSEIWIDATDSLQGGLGREIHFPSYERALEIRSGVTGIREVGPEQTRPGMFHATYSYEVGGLGEAVEVEVTTIFRRSQADAMRARLAGSSRREVLEDWAEGYSGSKVRVMPTAELEVEDDRDANVVTTIENYSMEGCDYVEDEFVYCDLLTLTMEGILGQPPSLDRSAPYLLPHPILRREVISLPASSPWQAGSVETEEENPWFEFTIGSRHENGRIELIYDLATLAQTVDPENLEEYTEAWHNMNDVIVYRLWAESADSQSGSEAARAVVLILGLGVMALFLGGIVALIVVVALLLRRRDKRSAAPKAPAALDASSSACPACRAPASAGSGYCPACGESLESVPGKRASRWALLTGLGILMALGVLSILGIVLALLIPNFLDALQKAKQKRTRADLEAITTVLELYHEDFGAYPVAASPDELREALEPDYSASLPMTDGWQNPWRYQCWKASEKDSGCATFLLASGGSDGEFEREDLKTYGRVETPRSEYTLDLVLGPEGWVQAPDGPSR